MSTLPELDSSTVEQHCYPIPPSGGMRVGMPKGVLLIHKPSGLGVAVDAHRSPHHNLREAYERLVALVAATRRAIVRAAAEIGRDGG